MITGLARTNMAYGYVAGIAPLAQHHVDRAHRVAHAAAGVRVALAARFPDGQPRAQALGPAQDLAHGFVVRAGG